MRSKRLFRFSLRGFFLLLTIICLLLGTPLILARRQQQTVKWITEQGGDVVYDWQEKPLAERKPPFFDNDVFRTVVTADFSRAKKITDISRLQYLTDLRCLWLYQTPIEDLSVLSSIATLKTLSLTECKVADLAPLTELPELSELNLDGTFIDDLSPLAKCEQLQTLWLSKNYARYERLSSLKNITVIYLPMNSGTSSENAALKKALPNIKYFANDPKVSR